MKRCKDCGEEKEAKEFNKDKSGTLGLDTYCRSCRSLRMKARHREMYQDPYIVEKLRAKNRASYHRNKDKHVDRNAKTWKRIKEDPLLHKRTLENKRLAYRIRMEKAGKTARFGGSQKVYSIEPMAYLSGPLLKDVLRFIERASIAKGLGEREFCELAGQDSRILRRARSEDRLSINTADKLLIAAGGALAFVLPELQEVEFCQAAA